jgi:hypothetical protein
MNDGGEHLNEGGSIGWPLQHHRAASSWGGRRQTGTRAGPLLGRAVGGKERRGIRLRAQFGLKPIFPKPFPLLYFSKSVALF